VAVAFNDMPFIRNHLFEQEFFDVGQVEVLRGPQGTLYGRNATAGVVNVISAKPSDQWEAMAKVETGNYNTRRLVGTLNVPVLDDRFDIRVAGAWTKRDGYSFNETTGKPIDGRDLWSARLTLSYKPIQQMQIYAIWEHFQEDDDRVRSSKQLCKKDTGLDTVDGFDINSLGNPNPSAAHGSAYYHALLSQGCLPTSLYSPEAFQTPNGQALPFIFAAEFFFNGLGNSSVNNGYILNPVDPYSSTVQSRNLRVVQSDISPTYKAKADVVQINADYDLTPTLKLSSQTGFNSDHLASTEDFNRFNTAPGLFANIIGDPSLGGFYLPALAPSGTYCDPQLGCSNKMVGEDLSREHAWQFNQEIRLASNFSGPFNFSAGANFTRYETVEDYFVFFNVLSLMTQSFNKSGPGDFLHCYNQNPESPNVRVHNLQPVPFYFRDNAYASNFGCTSDNTLQGTYIDPNPIGSVDGNGHNYFRSENPYSLTSYAGFGEAYYNVTPDVKLTAGLRWTDDKKLFWNMPSWVFTEGGGYPVLGIVDQQWKKWTGRLNANWTPKVDFTDQTLFYASYSRGYKGGGANPPAQAVNYFSPQSNLAHPPIFEPEYVNAYEVGTKNSLLDSALTLNGDVFYYDYKGYQISQIVDRTSINLNFDAKVHGAELESTWEPVPGLRFNFAGGYETSSVNRGQSAIDLIDRAAGHSDWVVLKPFIADTSNCVLPAYVVREIIQSDPMSLLGAACDYAYAPVGLFASGGLASIGITDFDPATAPNNGAGFAKDLSGNELPNTPHFTVSFGAQYAIPLSENWTTVVRTDAYWQSSSYARIFNDKPYDQLRGWTNVNFSLMFLNSDGWGVEGYIKNVFDTAAITGAFLNSDDTALTTNVFVTDPRLIGLNITKNW
jgi:outer membrane receptor protein involved in Fe transport